MVICVENNRIMLVITLKKVSPTRHQLTIRTEKGGIETCELETKTYLFHDLLHFAIESEAHLRESFYGLLDEGYFYSQQPQGNAAKSAGRGLFRIEAGAAEEDC